MRQELENAPVPETDGEERDRIRSITSARKEAAGVYWAWKKGTRDVNPHQVGALVSALSNIAGMIEKEKQEELLHVKREFEAYKSESESERKRLLETIDVLNKALREKFTAIPNNICPPPQSPSLAN